MSRGRVRASWAALLAASVLVSSGCAEDVREEAVPRAGAAAAASVPNAFGWQLGSEWTVSVREYATYLAEPTWITSEYRFRVVAVDPDANTLTVTMSFADPSLQPPSGQDELVRATYTVEQQVPTLSTLQPEGQGPKLPPGQAKTLLGKNFLSLELPQTPFSGEPTTVQAAGRTTQASKKSLGPNKHATFAKGAPWWLTYSHGPHLEAKLTTHTQDP